jgi:hypothetical protein
VKQALIDNRWTRHLKANLTNKAIVRGVQIWEKTQPILLHPDVLDSISWRWTADGIYSAASAYATQFEGSARYDFRYTIWCSDTPMKCCIFA